MVVILNEPVPEPLLPPLEEELLLPPLEDVDPLLAPDEDELLLFAPPEDDEPPPLADKLPPLELELGLGLGLELELVTASLLLLPPALQAATVRHEIAASRLSSSVERRMGSVLILKSDVQEGLL